MTTTNDAWDASIEPMELTVSVTCGNGRCRLEVRDDAPHLRGDAKHVITIDISERPARSAARRAFQLLADHMYYFQREAGR